MTDPEKELQEGLFDPESRWAVPANLELNNLASQNGMSVQEFVRSPGYRATFLARLARFRASIVQRLVNEHPLRDRVALSLQTRGNIIANRAERRASRLDPTRDPEGGRSRTDEIIAASNTHIAKGFMDLGAIGLEAIDDQKNQTPQKLGRRASSAGKAVRDAVEEFGTGALGYGYVAVTSPKQAAARLVSSAGRAAQRGLERVAEQVSDTPLWQLAQDPEAAPDALPPAQHDALVSSPSVKKLGPSVKPTEPIIEVAERSPQVDRRRIDVPKPADPGRQM